MRWRCVACDVLFTTEDRSLPAPVCFNCERRERVEPYVLKPSWAWGYVL